MTRIRTRCPSCGEIELGANEVALHLLADDPESAFYDFVCPTCSALVRKPADDQVAQLLIGGGVGVVIEHPHPERAPDGPPLTIDDVLDFMLALERGDWIDELASPPGASVGGVVTP
jgi:predicted RNA-binding Zn-ribbon protein involved in translation (DUF1610 family)